MKRKKDDYSQWYPREVRAIALDTEHLSLMEMGAYDRLLDWYYAKEMPLPQDRVQMHRICKAVAPEEQAAVDRVVDKFFILMTDGYHNNRADKELKSRKEISEVRRKAQAEKERQRVAKEGANGSAKVGANSDTPNTQHPTSSLKQINPSVTTARDHAVDKSGVFENDEDEGRSGSAPVQKIDYTIGSDDAFREQAKAKARDKNRDFHVLMNEFDKWVSDVGPRANPKGAFLRFIDGKKKL